MITDSNTKDTKGYDSELLVLRGENIFTVNPEEPIKEVPMNEQDAIERSYGAAVESLCKAFYDDFTAANGSPNAEAGAKERFRNGILHARQAHKIALELLP